jgi:hypothetical protein
MLKIGRLESQIIKNFGSNKTKGPKMVSVSIPLIIEYILVLMECIPMILKGSQNILERTEVAIKNG